ncbi:MAG: carotenoid oxygenase family protein [Leptolyngbyaceae cyanobacterium]
MSIAIGSQTCYQTTPKALLTASRAELSALPLTLLDPNLPLPTDLQGYLFMIAPVGSVDSNGLPYKDGTPLFNGDGMVYRFDFSQPGTATVTTSITKTPDFYADLATKADTEYADHGFQNHGISRYGDSLGFRNQPNTAFMPFRFETDDRDRLLVMSDDGRPYEIDTQTLDLVTPIGSNQEWRPQATKLLPFFPVLSTSHPYFDAEQQELITVNYGRSIASFLTMIPALEEAEKLSEDWVKWLEAIARLIRLDTLVQFLAQGASKLSLELLHLFFKLLSELSGVSREDFVYLIRWDGQGDIERWRLVLPDGSPLAISQGLHQIGVTRNHIILVETAFVVGLSEILENPFPNAPDLAKLLRRFLAKAPASNSQVYLIRRSDLSKGQYPAQSDKEVKITVQPTEFPMEVLHFVADYDDSEGKVTLHVGHWCAGTASEWVRDYDVLAADHRTPVPEWLGGMHIRGTDIGRLSRYVIQPETGEVLEAKTMRDDPATWGLALYTVRDALPTQQPAHQIKTVYWYSEGVFPDLLTQFDIDLFKDYRYRLVPTETLLERAKAGLGQPACLFRLDTETMTIVDVYAFDCGTEPGGNSFVVNSPQFMPRAGAGDDPTDGYIACTVFVGERSQLWLFDGQDLAKGPICKLGHPELVFGSSLHTVWLPEVGQRTADYCVPVRQDYEALVKKKAKDWPAIETLFEEHVYPHFP